MKTFFNIESLNLQIISFCCFIFIYSSFELFEANYFILMCINNTIPHINILKVLTIIHISQKDSSVINTSSKTVNKRHFQLFHSLAKVFQKIKVGPIAIFLATALQSNLFLGGCVTFGNLSISLKWHNFCFVKNFTFLVILCFNIFIQIYFD